MLAFRRISVGEAIRIALVLIAALALGAPCSAAESYALAMHGKPALPAGFDHLPWFNPDAPKGGRLIWGNLGTFDSLNPMIVRGIAVQQVRSFNFERGYVIESLMARGEDEPFTLYGLLAKTVETDDARDYVTFHLDERAHFSDGKPVTSEDVLFSWELLRDHGRPNHRQYYSKVARAEALDRLSVRFDLTGANDRELPLILGLMPVLPKHAVDPATFEETSLAPPIGSGPYRISAVKPGASLTFTRDPDYWGRDLPINRGLFNFDEVRFDYFREFEQPVRGIQAWPRRLPSRERTAALARRLRFRRGEERRGDPRHPQERPAATDGVPRLQHAPAGVFRHPRTPRADAVVRFRMDQQELLLRPLYPQRRLFSRF